MHHILTLSLFRLVGVLLASLCISACRGGPATGGTPTHATHASHSQTVPHAHPSARRQGASTHTSMGHGAGAGPDASTLPRGPMGVTDLRLRPAGPPREENSRDTFRTRVRWTHFAYDDPIVYPGQPGRSHLHLFLGNASVDAFTTADNIRSQCRSLAAGGIANCSAYWIPAVLDAQGKVVLPKPTSLIYYKADYQVRNPQDAVVPPQGLQILAGDADATPDRPQNRDRFSWNCHRDYNARTAHIPTNCAPGSTLSLSVRFPTCWDGRNLSSPDHKSHLSYAHQGLCPTTHPVVIPTLTFQVSWESGF